MYVVWLPIFIFIKLKMYEMGVPRGCIVMLCLGCGVELGLCEVVGVVVCQEWGWGWCVGRCSGL